LGLRVVAGVGSDEKAGLVRAYGAFDVINYRSEDLREWIKSITGGKGVDICFDNVGGAIFEKMARLMKWGGRLMPIGFTSGQIPSVPMNLLLLKNYSIVGVFTGAWVEKFPEQAAPSMRHSRSGWSLPSRPCKVWPAMTVASRQAVCLSGNSLPS
jgi:NADPH:quinone reductase